jgi:hypothetical protein
MAGREMDRLVPRSRRRTSSGRRHAVEVGGAVEDATRLDRSVEDVWQQLVDVGADGCGAACDPDVAVERSLAARHRLILRHADPANGPVGASHPNRRGGLPTHGTRRVPGLRREEVATLAGVSVDYYNRMERGNLGGEARSSAGTGQLTTSAFTTRVRSVSTILWSASWSSATTGLRSPPIPA